MQYDIDTLDPDLFAVDTYILMVPAEDRVIAVVPDGGEVVVT